eukprot:1004989-Alexandrium_andersonii.AAC.1
MPGPCAGRERWSGQCHVESAASAALGKRAGHQVVPGLWVELGRDLLAPGGPNRRLPSQRSATHSC